MRLSDKFDLIRSLHAKGQLAGSSERLPIERIRCEAIASTGHKTSQKPPFPYLFEVSSSVQSPWIPAGEPPGFQNFIGTHSYVNGGGYLRDCVLIGRYCSIGRRVTIGAGMHDMNGLSTSPALSTKRPRAAGSSPPHPRARRPAFTVIDSDVWIGDGAVILPGVHLAAGCVIGANSVVTRDTTPYGIYAGAPAILKRRRFPDGICTALVETAWWDLPYGTLKTLPLDRIDECLQHLEQARASKAAELATYAVLSD